MYVTKTITNVPIAVFADGLVYSPVKGLIASINPIQDLHGYDYPWPQGGGKNLFDGTFMAGSWDATTGQFNPGGDWITLKKTPCKPNTYYVTSSSNQDNVRRQRFIWFDNNQNIISSSDPLNDSIIGFSRQSPSDAAYVAYNIWLLNTTQKIQNFQLEEGSDATPYNPYSNISPITGWTGCEVTRTGKNLLEITKATRTINGVTFTVDKAAGTVTVNGTATAVTSLILCTINYPEDGADFVLSGCPTGGNVSTGYCIAAIGGTKTDIGAGREFHASSADNGEVYIRIARNCTVSNLVFYPMLRLASDTDPTFESYQGATCSITFPTEVGTVYAGTLDVTEGTLTVNRVTRVFQSGAWITGVYEHAFNLPFPTDPTLAPKRGSEAQVICSHFKHINLNPSSSVDNVYVGSSSFVIVYHNIAHTAEAFNAWLAEQSSNNTPLQISYELENPITYNLESYTLYVMPKENSISASTGNVTVTYIVNPLLIGRDFMINSGYVLLDGGGLDLSLTTAQTIAGIWERTVSAVNTGKPVWLYNTVYSENSEYTPIPVYIRFTSTTEILANAAGIVLTITSANTVTVTA